MRKFFLISLMTLCTCVMLWAENIAQITVGGETSYYETASDLKTAIAALPTNGTEATVKLLADVDFGTLNNSSANYMRAIDIKNGQKVILDLYGNTLSATLVTVDGSRSYTQIIGIRSGGKLTIKDTKDGTGVIENKGTKSETYDCTRPIQVDADGELHFMGGNILVHSGMGLATFGNLTIEDGTSIYANVPTHSTGYSNANAALMVYEGIIMINGGVIKANQQEPLFLNGGKTLIHGGEFLYVGTDNSKKFARGASADKLEIDGGTFSSQPDAALVDPDYVIRENDGKWIVVEGVVPTEVSVGTVSEIQSYIAAEGKYKITLLNDIVLEERVDLPRGYKLVIPNNITLAIREGGILVNSGKIYNNGNISILGAGFLNRPASVLGTGSITGLESSISVEGSVVNYTISNAVQLQYLGYLVGKGTYKDKTWNINMTSDITLPENVDFEPIGNDLYKYYITGVFNGNKHSIFNLHMESTTSSVALFRQFTGTIKNLNINNAYVSVVNGAAILTETLMAGSVIENVSISGQINASGEPMGIAAFNVSSAELTYEHSNMTHENDTIWFVNCTSNVNITAPNGYNAGAFIGTVSGAKGVFGFYNCKVAGQLNAASNLGLLIGYGSGNNSKLEVISLTNDATIGEAEGTPTIKCGYRMIGANGCSASKINDAYTAAGKDCNVIDPAHYIAVWDKVDNKYKYVAVEAGTLDNKNSTTVEWEKSSTWTDDDNETHVVPNESDNVTVNNASGVVVNDGVEAEAKKVTVAKDKTLTIKDGGSLTIGEDGLKIETGATVKVEEGATLVVGQNGITIEGTGKLIIEATEDGGTGVVLVDPAATTNTRPEASVELIPDAYKEGEDNYKHRYIGIPLYFEGAEEFTSANWVREAIQDGESVVTHAKIWNNGWQDVASISEFVPFKGYALTNESTHGVKYTFKGKLVGNGDGQMDFTYGFNLFANSYTAPINIQTLLNGLVHDNVKATIYMFENDKLRTVSKADFAGFRTPKFTVIPSLQAFFVLMDDGTSATEDINYAEAVYNNSLPNTGLYAPKRQETPDFNRVRINIASENGVSDEVYLIEAADYTNDFENGYDEVKYMNSNLNLFATTAYGRQSTKISNDLNGTFIGVQGNGTYTMSFDELVGEEYQIRDLQTNAIVTMSEDNTYMFTANGTDDARFVVESIAKMPTAFDNVDAAKMFINNNTLYISENNTNANIMIYAANGQLVLDEVAQPTVSLNGLASGVYTVRVANQTLKFVK